MASPAEQLASSINFGALAKATELKKRLLFTLGALLVYRLGTYLPLPGLDPVEVAKFFQSQSNGIIGLLDMFAGGAVSRMSIFALNIMPYISASIIVQLLSSVSPKLEALKKEGEAGRKKLNQYTRMGTVFLAALQAFGVAQGLISSNSGGNLVLVHGAFFTVSTVITLTAGTIFLMWLGEQITSRGVGNGTSLIIFAGIVARLPFALNTTFQQVKTGDLDIFVVFALLVMAVAVITFIVFMERAQRRLVVQFPKRQVGMRVTSGEMSHLPLKINSSGVIPPIFASSLLLLPLTFVNFAGANKGGDIVQWLARNLGHGTPLYLALYVALIVFFAFFYTAVVFNPADTAENLKKNGGFIPGYRPGKNTAEYLDYVLTRLTVVGSAYLAVVCLLPELLIAWKHLSFYFGGTSLLIVVSVMMDTVAQIHSHLLAHQYEGLIKKAKLKGRRG
ncbi:MAG TPA: preprotein translocase subunit SecY [Candidatus Acidoferrum sp.]|nr:preprotein translocase subunit SecY [Candidatus Acidoferrum sp.]